MICNSEICKDISERVFILPKVLKAVAMERCIGCYSCMFACSRIVHDSLSWSRSGILVRSLGGLSAGFEASYCLACPLPPCADACPSGALTKFPGGGVRYHRELCLLCGRCASACPVNAIRLDAETGEPVLCVHCGNCVPFCPHACLAMVDAAENTVTEEII